LDLKSVEQELRLVESRYASEDWKNPVVLERVAAEIRRIGTAHAEADRIQGFVFDVNGVDASRRPDFWPEHVFEADRLVVNFSFLPAGDLKNGMTLKVELFVPKAVLAPVVHPASPVAVKPAATEVK
jgi:hypothetical protein